MYTATALSPRRTQMHGSFAKAPSTSGRTLDRLRMHPRLWTRNVQYSGALRSLTAAAAAPEVLASIEAAPMGNTLRHVFQMHLPALWPAPLATHTRMNMNTNAPSR